MSSSPSDDSRPAPWEHGLAPAVLKHVGKIVNPLHTPATLTFDPQLEIYRRLYGAPPSKWGDVLGRYRLFQQLRRREGEREADHRTRQARWLREQQRFEREEVHAFKHFEQYLHGRQTLSSNPSVTREHKPADGAFVPLETWVAESEDVAGSDLELLLSDYPTGRVLVLDIAEDKDRLMARIAALIDHERVAAAIKPALRRGRESQPKIKRELDEFLRSIREHRIVQLWDLQLAGRATSKQETAKTLYPENADLTRDVLARSISRVLLLKINRACELQDQVEAWLPRLLATVGDN
jgi:hypothetical protein